MDNPIEIKSGHKEFGTLSESWVDYWLFKRPIDWTEEQCRDWIEHESENRLTWQSYYSDYQMMYCRGASTRLSQSYILVTVSSGLDV